MNIFKRINSSVSSLIQSAFSWTKPKEETSNPTTHTRGVTVRRDFTEGMQANESLTKGIYFGDYPGLKLASALAMAPVKVPVFFMGFPSAKTQDENEELDEILNDIQDQLIVKMQQIHIQRKREGTIWVWPRFNTILKKVDLEFIPDETVSDIIRDITTGAVLAIYTDEQITISTGFNETSNVRRIRKFTKTRIDVWYEGDHLAGLENRSMRNPIGMLPVVFANEPDGDEIRGHSLYGRILADLKAYHDTDYAEADLLAKFKAKLVAGIKDIDKYAQNNGYADANDMFENMDLNAMDILLYQTGEEEKPDILFADRATEGYEKSLKRRFRKIVEGTGVPEIAWGLKTEGNMASVEENMGIMLMYVRGDQRECTDSWKAVYSAILKLEMISRMMTVDFEIELAWNDLDAINDKTKSEIFVNFARGLAAIMNTAGITKQQLYKLWKMNFPQATEEDYEEFVAEIWNTAKFKQYASAPLNIATGIDGELPENPDDFGITP